MKAQDFGKRVSAEFVTRFPFGCAFTGREGQKTSYEPKRTQPLLKETTMNRSFFSTRPYSRMQTLGALVSIMSLFGMPSIGHSQDLAGMINQEMASMNAKLAANQRRINNMVQRDTQDPRVRAGYAQYLARARKAGVQPTSLFNYAYGYAATQGY